MGIYSPQDLVVKDLDYGRGLPYLNNLLDATFTAHTIVPYELKQCMKIILSPAEFILWKGLWINKLDELLKGYVKEEGQQHLAMDHITGEGDYTRPQYQAEVLPR